MNPSYIILIIRTYMNNSFILDYVCYIYYIWIMELHYVCVPCAKQYNTSIYINIIINTFEQYYK